ncbi:hypothetical protein EHQ53_17945 [Leptospira langatensis]|uniref:Uncharacterized protein n=2 Tax=Leptospira langatensis TaxID=2484983 RepID=A0A5F1ZPI6_9LEPT|nr:hypothetical protein EHO57_02185 [Leptospira langatensis]TGL38778.1 hypothetical protein EHQ53_17945 [Leptospira langatensis]
MIRENSIFTFLSAFALLYLILFPVTGALFAVPLDPDQKVYQPGELFQENFLKIDFPEKALVRTESRKRWRAVPLKDRAWLVIWRKLDRTGEEQTGIQALEAVFPNHSPEKIKLENAEILQWTKEDNSGGNPLQILFYLIRKGDEAYTIYIAFYKERADLKEWFGNPSRYLKTK